MTLVLFAIHTHSGVSARRNVVADCVVRYIIDYLKALMDNHRETFFCCMEKIIKRPPSFNDTSFIPHIDICNFHLLSIVVLPMWAKIDRKK